MRRALPNAAIALMFILAAAAIAQDLPGTPPQGVVATPPAPEPQPLPPPSKPTEPAAPQEPLPPLPPAPAPGGVSGATQPEPHPGPPPGSAFQSQPSGGYGGGMGGYGGSATGVSGGYGGGGTGVSGGYGGGGVGGYGSRFGGGFGVWYGDPQLPSSEDRGRVGGADPLDLLRRLQGPGRMLTEPGSPPFGMRTEPPVRLEEMIGGALGNNPDIKVAEARLREAEAALMQARQRIVREVTRMFEERAKLESDLQAARDAIRRNEEGHGPEQERQEIERNLRNLDGELSDAHAEIRYLLGIPPGEPQRGEPPPRRHQRPIDSSLRPPIPERYRKMLDAAQRITMEVTQAMPLQEVLQPVPQALKISLVLSSTSGMWDIVMPAMSFSDVTCEELMTAVAESTGNKICFVFRDYGILVAETEQAKMIPGATIPPYIPYHGPSVESEPTPPTTEAAR